jgi:capsular polysaccharide biosynthesis protein
MISEKSEEGISLLDLINMVKNNIILIISIVFVTTILGGLVSMFVIDPKYESNADVMIQVQSSSSEVGYDYTTAQKLVTTIAEFLRKEVVLEKAVDIAKVEAQKVGISLNLDAEDIKHDLTVTSSSSSYFINISYVNKDPKITGIVVNAIIDAGIDLANSNASFSSLSNKIARTSTAKEGKYDSPNKVLYTLIGAFIGMVIAGGIVLLKELLNNTYKTRNELESAYGINVIGVIPKYDIR